VSPPANARRRATRPWARAAFTLVFAGAACTIQERTDRVARGSLDDSTDVGSEFISPWGEAEPPRAVRSGNLIWIWGMPGAVPAATPPRLVDGGAGAETRLALANITEILTFAGADLRDVAQCSVFVAHSADLGAVEAAYVEFFPSPAARTAVVDGGLALGARVELECTAVVSDGV
jgi:2-iminobutanoate/2-iminopropanoate deaminase